jgi:uncharacterized protein YecT (DUF1311 family)
MRHLAVLAILGFSCWSGFGQDSAQWRACNASANTQAELNQCASEEAKRVDVELNDIYAKLLLKLSKDPDATLKVRAMERAWIAYRDPYLAATYPAKDKQHAYGSMFPMEFDLVHATLTRRQVTALTELLLSHD